MQHLIQMVLTLLNGLKRIIMTFCTDIKHSVFRNYPPLTFSETKTESFQRNNCGGSQNGSWVDYSKTYTSNLSEQDLQQKIVDDINNFNTQGQANANANGTCSSGCTPVTVSGVNAYPGVLVGLSSTYLYSTGRAWKHVYRYPLSTINSGGSLGTLSTLSNSGYNTMLFPTSSELLHSVNQFQSDGNNLIDVYYISPSPNACQGPVNKYINLPSNRYLLAYKLFYIGLGNSLNGMLYASSYYSADNDLSIYFKQDAGPTNVIATINAPTSGGKKYKFTSVVISQPNDDLEVYITMSCRTDSGKSRRIVVYRLVKDFFGLPTGVQEIYNGYSSGAVLQTAGWIGGTFYVFYSNDSGGHVLSLGSPSIPSPGIVNSFVSNGVNAYVVTNTGLKRFNLGAWTTLYSY